MRQILQADIAKRDRLNLNSLDNRVMIHDISDMSNQTLPLPPGRHTLPLVGETIQFLRNPNFIKGRIEEYGDVFRTHLLGSPTIVMAGQEANRFLLNDGMDNFSWGDGWPYAFQTLLGRSLFLQDGEEHKRNRKLIVPAFHGRALRGYVETMDEIIGRYLNRWETMHTFPWFIEFKRLTFEVASTLLLGSNTSEESARLSDLFTTLTNGFFSLPVNLKGTTFGKAVQARDELLTYVEEQVRLRRANPGNDALSMLIESVDENGDRLSMEELKAQALLMIFAGHETTTSMLTSFAMVMAQRPDLLRRLREEQASLSAETPPSLETLRKTTLLDNTFREVERLYPPVAGGFRGVVKGFDYAGYHIPAGYQVLYRIDAAHQDPSIFPNPQVFEPDRYLTMEAKTLRYALVGFGGGPRVCIGKSFALLEAKLIAWRLLRDYEWSLLPDQDLTIGRIPTLRPKDDLQVTFQRRHT